MPVDTSFRLRTFELREASADKRVRCEKTMALARCANTCTPDNPTEAHEP